MVPAASVAASRAAAMAWREGRAWRALADRFAPGRFADAATADGPLLREAIALLRAHDWLPLLLDPLIAGLAADPWFEPPLAVRRDPRRAVAVLFDNPVVTIGLASVSAAALRGAPPPAAPVFTGRRSVVRYLRAGGATLARWRADPLPACAVAAAMGRSWRLPDRRLRDGQLLTVDGRVRCDMLIDAAADVVTLTATLKPGGDPLAREYDAATGAFRGMATTDEGAARAQMLLSLLRALGADDTASFAAATRDPAHFLRWSAMCEWLAHAPTAAWPRLTELAAHDPHPEVRAAATATLARFGPRLAA